jgi:hypothetical protein
LLLPPSNGLMARLPEQRTLLSSVDEVRIAATAVAASARRVLTLFSYNLEPEIYEFPAFIDAVKRFVLGPRYAKVRVLVVNPGRVVYNRHEFIQMARKLTSCIEIRNAVPEFREFPASYLVADDQATLYRLQHTRWEGICEPRDAEVARTVLQRFDEAWTPSVTPRHLEVMRI